MPTVITATKAVEKSTFVVTVSFLDEDGSAVSPDTMAWSLVDRDGNIINSREDVAIDSPGTSENIVLSGLDLAMSAAFASRSEEIRYIVIEGTYTSLTHGSGLPLKDQLEFTILNLKKVPN